MRSLLALRGVVHVRAGLERARVDPQVGQPADERVGDDLEGEGAERLLSSAARGDSSPVLGSMPDDRRHVDRRRQVVDDGVEHRLDALVLERGAAEDRARSRS